MLSLNILLRSILVLLHAATWTFRSHSMHNYQPHHTSTTTHSNHPTTTSNIPGIDRMISVFLTISVLPLQSHAELVIHVAEYFAACKVLFCPQVNSMVEPVWLGYFTFMVYFHPLKWHTCSFHFILFFSIFVTLPINYDISTIFIHHWFHS